MSNAKKYSDDELDNLFRTAEKRANHVPAFDAAFWSEMEAMLPDKKKNRAAIWWWSGIAALFLVALGSWMYFQSASSSAKTANQNQTTSSESQVNQLVHADDASKTEGSKTQQGTTSADDDSQRTQKETSTNYTVLGQKLKTKKPIVEPKISGEENRPQTNQVADAIINNGSTIEFMALEAKKPTSSVGTIYQSTLKRKSTVPLFYAQLSTGIGQSSQRTSNEENQLAYSFALSGGIRKEIKKMELSFGLQLRMEQMNNVVWRSLVQNNSYQQMKINQLYSVEFPLSIGTHFNRSILTATMTPGIQVIAAGNQTNFENSLFISRDNVMGRVAYSKSMTMELGVNYWYTLQPDWYVGVSCNADVLRPFNSDYYLGAQRLFPLNGQLSLRRLF